MKKSLVLLFVLSMLACGKTVKYKVADISNVSISGEHEHTLVVPPTYPSFTRGYTANFQLDFHDEYLDEPDVQAEENEQDDGGGDGGEATFKTSMKWSLSGSGAAFGEGADTTSASVSVVFSEGNTDDVLLTFQVSCECIGGKGIGDSQSATFTVYSPVWDVYHPLSMYVEASGIVAPVSVGVGDSFQLTVNNWNNTEYDRRQGWGVQTPLDSLLVRWSLPPGFTGGGTSPSLTVTAPGAAQASASVGASIDDVAPAIPANERGTRDDEPHPLTPVSLAVVEVASLLPDQGVEVDDGDNDPDTKTFLVPVASSGSIAVTATPYPPVAEAGLPTSWSLTGGTGTGKLQRTVDRTSAASTTITCTCGTLQKSVRLLVYKVEVTNIKFNHDVESMQNDAMNLRQDYSTAFDISNGEWTRQGVNLPACYVSNRSITVKARFEVLPTEVLSATVCATAQGTSLGDLAPTNISFSNGVSTPEYVSLPMSGSTPACMRKSAGDTWQWKVAVSFGNTTEYYDIGTTSHTIYTIRNEPLAPWNNTADHPQNAWRKALDFVFDNASCNNLSADFAILGSITNYLFSGHGLVYDTYQGRSKYTENYVNKFLLARYIDKSNNNIVNCYDQAGAVFMFGRLAGINVSFRYLDPFGYINNTYLVGITSFCCNNPFYNSSRISNHNPLVGNDKVYPHRSFFGNHAFNKYNGFIFDACAGPQLGFLSEQQYIDSVIDKSTLQESFVSGSAGNIIDININDFD